MQAPKKILPFYHVSESDCKIKQIFFSTKTMQCKNEILYLKRKRLFCN